MIRLEQIQLLEKKIDKAIEVIELLKKENQALRSTLNKSQGKMSELETLLEQFKGEQKKIEAGIISALSKLDHLEDEVSEVKEPPNSNQVTSRDLPPSGDNTETPDPEQTVKSPETGSDSPAEEQEAGNIADQEDSSEPEDNEVPEEKEIELDIF